ncbi:hypothetical protein L7F22_039813 [Adiantum nelumboides]|nr:hypothetical protein [Adiantum nelumboides]
MANLEDIVESKIEQGEDVVKNHSIDMYEMIAKVKSNLKDAIEAKVDTKYKIVAKKVKPIAAPLLEKRDQNMEKVSKEQSLRDMTKSGHKFTE